eukprot:scaffold462267_cov33-Prasinocladus_malaysianus.AAC.1
MSIGTTNCSNTMKYTSVRTGTRRMGLLVRIRLSRRAGSTGYEYVTRRDQELVPLSTRTRTRFFIFPAPGGHYEYE